MNTEDLFLDNFLDSAVGGNILLDDLIQTPSWMMSKNLGNDAVEQALKENNIMEELEKSDLQQQLFSAPLCGELDHLVTSTASTNYMDWLNLGGGDDENNCDSTATASNSSDSGLSSDFHYDQQLSPSMEMDRSTPTHMEDETASVSGSEACSSVDVDNVSSPEGTLCPSSPCSDINSFMDETVPEIRTVTVSGAGPASSLVFPVALKDLNLREIKAVKIIRNGASSVLAGMKATASSNIPDAIKKLLGPMQVSLATQMTATNSVKVNNNGNASSANGSSNQTSSYPPIILSDEERRLLSKEGIELPTHYPLTKHEERELKRIRRKIRNKISAQDSRKRKRVYMDGLEDRVKHCTDENHQLQKRIRLLETENKSLVSQLKRLQSILTGHASATAAASSTSQSSTSVTNTAAGTVTGAGAVTGANASGNSAQPATCLLVLLLSFALFLLPNLRPDHSSSKRLTAAESSKEIAQSILSEMPPFAGRSRALLQDTLNLESDADFDLEEIDIDVMDIGQEVVVGGANVDTELYMSVPLGPFLLGPGGGVSGAAGGGRNDPSKTSQWEFKYGKQYPPFNGKRNVHSLLAEHDYHGYDMAAKRSRFKSAKEEAVEIQPQLNANELNRSSMYDAEVQLVTEQLHHHQPIVLRVSEDL